MFCLYFIDQNETLFFLSHLFTLKVTMSLALQKDNKTAQLIETTFIIL